MVGSETRQRPSANAAESRRGRRNHEKPQEICQPKARFSRRSRISSAAKEECSYCHLGWTIQHPHQNARKCSHDAKSAKVEHAGSREGQRRSIEKIEEMIYKFKV